VCTFDFGTNTASISGAISGVVTIKGMKVAVSKIELTLTKAETIDGTTEKIVIKSMDVTPKSSEEDGELDDINELRIRFGLAEIATQTTYVPSDSAPGTVGLFGPTVPSRCSGTSNNFRTHALSVSYFLKFAVSGADGSKYWDSKEVHLFRTEMPLSAAEDGYEEVEQAANNV
jgi:hypothetical protein